MFAWDSYSKKAKDAYIPIRNFVNTERLSLGNNTSAILATDPKLFLFTLSKYKFASKILEGKNVIELGCMDGGGTLLLSKMTNSVTAIDFYEDHIKDSLSIKKKWFLWKCQFLSSKYLRSESWFY